MFYRPLFGDGRLVWRDSDTGETPAPASDEELDGALPGHRLALDRTLADDSLVRARRGLEGAARAVVEDYRSRGIEITLDAARERVAVARSRADNARREEA